MHTHPAAELFPMLSDSALDKLAEDIRANGLQTPISVVLDQDGEWRILDGRNRYEACRRVGVEPKTCEWEGGDPIAFVMSMNLQRRHLSESQRAMVAVEVERLYAKEAKARQRSTLRRGRETPVPADLPGRGEARAQAAAALNVSPRLVQDAKKVASKAVPELASAVRNGEVTVHAASRVAELPEAEQREAVSEGAAAVVLASRKAPKSVAVSPPRAFAREDSVVEEVRDGVVSTSRTAEDPSGSRPGKKVTERKVVRELIAQGFTVSDIAEKTGMKKSAIYHLRSEVVPRKSVLAGALEDAEVFSETWSARADALPKSWLGASAEELTALIDTLTACRSATAKAIRRLSKEVSKKGVA